jgi:hypothetical protein
MRNLHELNINEGGKPVKRDAPGPDIVSEFEQHYGVSLPEDYLRLLNHANGGHPELDSILPEPRSSGARWAVNVFYHLDGDKESDTSLWKAVKAWRSILGKLSLPFATDAGGNQFYLDLSTDPPAVKVCIHDENFRAIGIAPSFEKFIDGLEIDPDMI